MKKLVLSLAMTLAAVGACYGQDDAQENFTNHQVAMGETVLVIAKKYKITPRDIYDYNPDAVEGVSPNASIRVPLHRQLKPKPAYTEEVYVYQAPAPAVKSAETSEAQSQPIAETTASVSAAPSVFEPTPMQTMQHIVLDGETLTSLARKYNTTIKAIEKENPGKLKSGLQTGETLKITTIPRLGDPSEYVSHDVASGETLTGLARKYGTTIEAITESNRITLKRGLQTGQQLMILPGNAAAGSPEINRGVLAAANAVEHMVKSGETLMTLAQKYNTTVEDITASNQSKLGNGIQAGQILTIKNNATAISTVAE